MMFQIWLGSFKSCRVQQTRVQRLTSSNKEQVAHTLVLGDLLLYELPQRTLIACAVQFLLFTSRDCSCLIISQHRPRVTHLFMLIHNYFFFFFFFSTSLITKACNVLYLNSVETESLTGPEAVSKATKCTLALSPRPVATVVHFKVSSQGITLTDSKRRYILRHCIYCFGVFFMYSAVCVFRLMSYTDCVYTGYFSGGTTQSAV